MKTRHCISAIFSSLIFSACVSKTVAKEKELAPGISIKDAEVKSLENSKNFFKVITLTEAEANRSMDEIFMGQVYFLRKSFEVRIEPYYGKDESSVCRKFSSMDNKVEKSSKQLSTYMETLANKHLALVDCLPTNNEYRVHYEFLACYEQKKVYEVRYYYPLSAPAFNRPLFACSGPSVSN